MHAIDGIEPDKLDGMHPACIDVLHYWQERTGAVGGIPKLTDIDLMDLWRLASHITIKDVEREIANGAMRFRWRYAGTMLYELTGQELTGQYMDDVFDADDDIFAIENNIILKGTPHYWKRSLQNSAVSQSPVLYECLTVPLTNFTGEIGHTLSVITWPEDEQNDTASFRSNGQLNDPDAQEGILVTHQ